MKFIYFSYCVTNNSAIQVLEYSITADRFNLRAFIDRRWCETEPSIRRVWQSMVRRLLRSDWSAVMGAIFGQAVMIEYIAARQLFQLQVYYAL
mgnify:CR=1 FL=1